MNLLSEMRLTTLILALTLSTTIHAQKINDHLEVSGWLRANIQDKSYSPNDQHLKFDATKLMIQYNNEVMSGQFEYRCYQFDKICDFSALVDANLSYHIANNPEHKLTAGIQALPFGPARNWSSNWYGGLLVNTGLEDIHNLGIKYQYPWTDQTQLELAYFVSDAGNYFGKSQDAARYSANLVDTGQDSPFSDLEERDLWLLRVKHEFELNQHTDLNIGASYWYSTIKNQSESQSGKSERWATFATLQHLNWILTLTAGQTRLENKDPLYPHISMVGSFDTAYTVANDANFYTADLYYPIRLGDKSTITPYATYSYLDKVQASFQDSSRFILGTQWDFYPISIAAEYIVGESDYFIGGEEHAFAQGDSTRERLFNLLFLYHF